MAEPAYFLTERDVAFLRELAAERRARVTQAGERPGAAPRGGAQEDYLTPEVYVGLVPAGGLAGRAGVVPGYAACRVYRVLADPVTGVKTLAEAGFSRDVYNVGLGGFAAGTYLVIERDKYGTWLANGTADDPEYGTGTGTGTSEQEALTLTQQRCVDGVLTETTYRITFPPGTRVEVVTGG